MARLFAFNVSDRALDPTIDGQYHTVTQLWIGDADAVAGGFCSSCNWVNSGPSSQYATLSECIADRNRVIQSSGDMCVCPGDFGLCKEVTNIIFGTRYQYRLRFNCPTGC